MEYLKRKFWKDIGGEIGWRLKRNSWFVQYLQEIGQKDRAIAWNECIITLHVFALNDLSLRPVKIVWTISSMIKKKEKKRKKLYRSVEKLMAVTLKSGVRNHLCKFCIVVISSCYLDICFETSTFNIFFFLFASLKEGVLVRNKDK